MGIISPLKKWPKINGFHMVSLSFLLHCKWNCGPLYLWGPYLKLVTEPTLWDVFTSSKKWIKTLGYLGMYWGEVICLATIYIPSLKLTARFRSVCTGQIWASFLRLPTFATNKRPNKLGNWGYFTL